MLKNQKGFGHIILLLVLLLVLIVVGVLAAARIGGRSISIGGASTNGMYAAKDFGVNFERRSDKDLASRYTLSVYYGDSFDPKSTCPARLDGFSGYLKISYASASAAKVDVLQSIRPQTAAAGGDEAVACPQVVIPPYTRTADLDKKWVENGSGDKTLLMNGKTYHLTVDRSTRAIKFWGADNRVQTQPYLPDGVAQLYAYPMYKNCMTIGQLEAYARAHGITTADSKYPGLTAQIQAIPKLVLEGPDGSRNVLLVIGNDYVKGLIDATSREKTTDVCHVVASAPVYTGVD